jgi:hypothetical protein
MPEDTRRPSAKARTMAGQGLGLQSFCISAIPGGQMQEAAQRREQLPRRTRCGTSNTFAEPNAVDSGRYASAAVGS